MIKIGICSWKKINQEKGRKRIRKKQDTKIEKDRHMLIEKYSICGYANQMQK